MLETKHEELHLSVVTVVVRCTWQSQYSASNCKIFYCYFVAPQKSAHILTRNRGTRIKKAGKLYYICVSVLVCILMQHLSRSAVLMDDQFCISREGLKKKKRREDERDFNGRRSISSSTGLPEIRLFTALLGYSCLKFCMRGELVCERMSEMQFAHEEKGCGIFSLLVKTSTVNIWCHLPSKELRQSAAALPRPTLWLCVHQALNH